MNSRSLLFLATFALCVGAAGSALAHKRHHHPRPIRSITGGANQKWACQQLAINACDLAKRCDPDHSERRCKRLRERCAKVKDRPSRTATEDDVSECANAVENFDCKQVTFDNSAGVRFNLHKLETCRAVAKDDPMPPARRDPDGDH